ncbi:hypothetical protein B0H16DRAFT_1562905 [Mycena metata]|uniref:Uncharacterized protein n=1 Tax=Mycena metata TaxID=1033252 RepID=A0AAD7IGL5_9AGAR|nr:hypothetical protein B0H16DRAFT_1562905 [Mycena metata]
MRLPLTPVHPKPVVLERPRIKLPPAGGLEGDEAYGRVVSIGVEPQTIVTIFGITTAMWSQKVKAELLDAASLTSQAIVFWEGWSRKSLIVDDTSNETITWGPYDKKMMVELTFFHKKQAHGGWSLSEIKHDKMKEQVCSNNGHRNRKQSLNIAQLNRGLNSV